MSNNVSKDNLDQNVGATRVGSNVGDGRTDNTAHVVDTERVGVTKERDVATTREPVAERRVDTVKTTDRVVTDDRRSFKETHRGRDWTNIPALRDFGLFLPRVFSCLLLLHGIHKILHFSDFSSSLSKYPVSSASPTMFAVLVILGMLCLPILTLLGFLTRWAALLGAIMMGAIWYLVHIHGGTLISPQTGGVNNENTLAYIFLFLPLVFTGAGRWSIDHLLARGRGKRKALASERTVTTDRTVAAERV